MHRHGYKGRKFGRQRDQRTALIKGLADSLVLYESIETTLPKAKEVVSYTEKLITKAKAGGLHNRRQIIAKLSTLEASHKLVDEIAPKLSNRSSGHLRIKKSQTRIGDGAVMARVSFVDNLSKKESATKKSVAKTNRSSSKESTKNTTSNNKASLAKKEPNK